MTAGPDGATGPGAPSGTDQPLPGADPTATGDVPNAPSAHGGGQAGAPQPDDGPPMKDA